MSCGCGEISIDGGKEYCKCLAKDWTNFLRVDDEGNEIVVKVKEKNDNTEEKSNDVRKPNKKELIEMLERMVKTIEELPATAMQTYINHYDFGSSLMLILSILLNNINNASAIINSSCLGNNLVKCLSKYDTYILKNFSPL